MLGTLLSKERGLEEEFICLFYFKTSATIVLAESSLVSLHSYTPAKLELSGQQNILT